MSSCPVLPSAPSLKQKYAYFGRRQRWLPFFSFGSFLGVVYAMWRLSLQAEPARLLWPLIVLTFLCSYLGLRGWSWGRRYDLWDHRQRIEGHLPETFPSVDVFLPSCGEPLEVLRNTYAGVAGLHWPGVLTVYALDDSARPEVEDLARSFGFVYLVRPDRPYMRKAGNLAHGYRNSSGDLILILDADFAARPDTLTELTPYFDDEHVGIVQSPQYFALADGMTWIARAAGAVQVLFYRFIQPARDKVDAAICVGTNAIYRRKAMDAIGGFPLIAHSEDVFTGVEMMRVGYKLRYVPVVLATGISPDTLSAFCNMIYRWCSGSITLMCDSRFRSAPLSPAQRICFWAGFIYYITAAVSVILGLVPGILMAVCFPDQVHPRNILPLLPSIISSLIVMPAIYGTARVNELIRLNLVTGYCFLYSIFDFCRGRTVAWVPTGAAVQKSVLERRVRRGVLYWGGLGNVAMVSAIVYGGIHAGFGRFWVMALDAFYQIWIWLPIVLPRPAQSPAPAPVDSVAVQVEHHPAPAMAIEGALVPIQYQL